jgi:hypothetical protein
LYCIGPDIHKRKIRYWVKDCRRGSSPRYDSRQTLAGYQYFSLTKKKNTTLQLECVLNGKRIALALP